ncbi:Vacuolar protein sorting-associated protein 28-like protein 2 [Hibiscus syriacus]|uniref:Vacuolar protein sorting-associated protein 28-like protein 2 n=1 Tax=Hibiscus syriacus TaxID=106335 RepID=A0A6A3AS04_HIBSY|nr:vacuolar protein sorting-associated protein 28 homolog 1-like [Hibiscus syriacus]KAE8707511.1 Vacuolar protein sorting-associated protein 28-like protein 2 [Hibiscus syriacus]
MDVKLWHDKCEREMYVFFMELYATPEVTEELEKAYVRDAIFSSSEYATECLKLIAHFETSASTLKGTIPSIHCFAYTSKMDCPCAINHLVTYGVVVIVDSRASAASSAFTSTPVLLPDF